MLLSRHVPKSCARNKAQSRYIEMLEADKPPIVIASGYAGTGKSYLATQIGLQKLKAGHVNKLVLTRPAVCIDEQHGFLPGTLEEKMTPWMRPITDVMDKIYTPDEVNKLVKNRIVEICPLAFMRGRTFEDAWVICDEAQNCTPKQMLMLLTRIGKNSKIIVTGDPIQFDRGFEVNGLSDLIHKLEHSKITSEHIDHIAFGKSDVVRHPVINHVLSLYN